MIVSTAWSQDGEPAGVLTWRYAPDDFPSGAINAVLAAVYNDPRDSLDHPFLFIARDAEHRQAGLLVTDPEGVELDLPDINSLYWGTLDNANALGRDFSHGAYFANVESDAFAIPWFLPESRVFPVDPLNAILAALYSVDVQPFVYPVYDRVDVGTELRQVGLLVSTLVDLGGTASENWRSIRDRYDAIFLDDRTHPADVPWDQKEWSLA